MPKGISSHGKDMNGQTMHEQLYKPSMPDRSNQGETVTVIEELGSIEITRIFIQIASLTNLDVEDTTSFMSKFVVGNKSITKGLVIQLFEKHREEILKANRCTALFIHDKYRYTSPLKNLSVINKALTQISETLDLTEKRKSLFTGITDLDELFKFANIQRSLSQAYKNWVERVNEWIHMMSEMIVDPSYDPTAATPESNILKASDIAVLLEENGMHEDAASRMASIIVYGEQKMESLIDAKYTVEETMEVEENALVSSDDNAGTVF